MSIELPKEARSAAIASIERYFLEEHGERIGNMAAGALLNFFLADIGPAVYNLAVAQAQERMQARVADLDIELHAEAFTWWTQRKGKP
ncbi:DUF2164 domain-containing protein [Simplicispira suum]|jgi:uncharacterized protein (DUF2164 family)|uniref:DUF2164 domain-containing protein n=1 Tax=Simplicispira suum TaxID=2109915 RepID=A0A2S0N468_9BURK|nr:DUF2164 domain-containing protein [Simplicispira suum]AVO42942.1 DUF2164 domain-containing protein [Simplicispira suum]MBW7833244.1 DUF2164 domain-containing protein [Simplicispira suum]MCB1977886.1 DUF2164 domain-containing protein [Burkholderiaceae bacterium]MCO5105228.1 DUF2164 domain-containing protein [Burkholderiaceae bacterium]